MLGNFSFYNPTKIYFGENSLSNLGKEMKQVGKNILLVYGKGSIKKIGLYDEIVKILKSEDKNIFDLEGVMPNPTTEKLYEGIKIVKENNIDFILAIGGGSVIDYSKALSASAYSEENPWEKYFLNGKKVDNPVIPIGSILTMVGTGSEMNSGSVMSDNASGLKLSASFGEKLFPKFSILNPTYTFSVSKYQMISGIFDIVSHLLEQYFSGNDENVSDYVIEGLLKSVIASSKIANKNPNDYEARSNIMWASTWALNGFVGKGKRQDWMVHMIGHAISATTDASHGMTLASVSLSYYRHILPFVIPKFKRFATNVWDVNAQNLSDEEIAKRGIDEMEKWMRELGIVVNPRELGVSEEIIEDILNSTVIFETDYKSLTKEDVKNILIESMKL